MIEVAKRVIRNPMWWCFLAFSFSYAILAHIVPLRPMAEAMRVLQMSLAASVVYAYLRNAMRCFTCAGWPPGENLIALGIVISWASICINGVWALIWRLSGQPGWMVNNDVYHSWVALNAVAATIHILAPNLVGIGVPTADRLRLGAAIGGAALVFAMLSLLSPDLRPFADFLRPYIEDPAADAWIDEASPPPDRQSF